MWGDGQVFPPTADDLLAWQESTVPRPSDEDVLRAGRDLPAAERERLRTRIGHRDRG